MLIELQLNMSTSRGRETYGWSLITLTVAGTGWRYRARGGGCDLPGTVLGEYLEVTYQTRLRALAKHASSSSTSDKPSQLTGALYGMYLNHATGAVTLDGACGIESIRHIAQQIGIYIMEDFARRGKKWDRLVGYTVVHSDMPIPAPVT
jgi:hypothetical protein